MVLAAPEPSAKQIRASAASQKAASGPCLWECGESDKGKPEEQRPAMSIKEYTVEEPDSPT